jgi:hypothetical protein
MIDQDLNSGKAERKQRSSGLRGHVAAIIALFALAIVAVAWFWTTRQPQQTVLPNGIIVIGVGAFVTAVVAYVRDMDASDVLEMLGDVIFSLFSVIGAILKGIWNWFLGLIGLD